MAAIRSPVGVMVLKMEDISVKGRKLIIKGKMGLWESEVVVGEKEAWEVARMLMKGQVLAYFFTLPFRALIRRLEEEEETETRL